MVEDMWCAPGDGGCQDADGGLRRGHGRVAGRPRHLELHVYLALLRRPDPATNTCIQLTY